jgi:peptide/nickel transport system substrate-binding protein
MNLRRRAIPSSPAPAPCARTAPRLCLLLVIGLAGCADSHGGALTADEDVPEQLRYGGTAVIAANTDIDDISPLTFRLAVASQIQLNLLFTPLVMRDEEYELVPYLARSWELNEDSTVLTFHLRDDVRWHDGAPTTAEDVKFTYDLAKDPATGFVRSGLFRKFGEAEVVDSVTFRVRTVPHLDFLAPWALLTPVPKHILGSVPAAELSRHPFGSATPLGNGPFRFVSRVPGQSWTFAANEDFPEDLGGRPYLDRIVYRSIPEQTTLLTELLTSGIDFYLALPEHVGRIASGRRARTVTFAEASFDAIAWNNRRPLFRDGEVRRAMTLAIDRQGIIDGIYGGYGDLSHSSVPPAAWQYDSTAGKGLAYDPDEARRLLARAGWEDRDRDGVLEDAEGREFRFTMLSNRGAQARADAMEKVQSDLKSVGIAAELRIVEFNSLIAVMTDPKRDFDAVLTGLVTGFTVDPRAFFHCEEVDSPLHLSGFCDPAVDRLLDSIDESRDLEEAKRLWFEYQRAMADQQPYSFLYHPRRIAGVSNRLRGARPDARGEWVSAARWWIVPDQR